MRKYIVFLLLGLGGFIWTVPSYAQQGFCQPALPPLQPEEPVAMNSVAFHRLVKTIHMEKEVFVCQDGTIKDVQIYTEIVENLRLPSTVVEKTFEVVTCLKNPLTAAVKCDTTKPPVLPLPPDTPPGLDPNPRPPRDPIEMNTVQVGSLVKTVMSEKEVFEFSTPVAGIGLIRDITIFTEIIEDLSLGANFVAEKKVEVAVCDKTLEGDVIGCAFWPTQVLFPLPTTPPG